jgi:hypothetical protein
VNYQYQKLWICMEIYAPKYNNRNRSKSHIKTVASHLWSTAHHSQYNIKKQNSVAFSPKESYTDWATATGRWILVPTFVECGISRGQRGRTPTAVNLNFLDRSRYFFIQVAPHLCLQVWVDPIPDPMLRRKFGSAGNRARDLWDSSQELCPLDHRGGH